MNPHWSGTESVELTWTWLFCGLENPKIYLIWSTTSVPNEQPLCGLVLLEYVSKAEMAVIVICLLEIQLLCVCLITGKADVWLLSRMAGIRPALVSTFTNDQQTERNPALAHRIKPEKPVYLLHVG